MSNELYVENGIRELVWRAMNKCPNINIINPSSDPKSDNYAYLYRAIGDPSRFAAIERKKLGEHCDAFQVFAHPRTDWLESNGVYLRTGKALRLLLPTMSNSDISVLAGYVADELREGVATGANVQVSDTPSEVYTIPSRRAEDVANSCMRGKRDERFQLYDDIDCCRIAYVKDGEYLIGRALLWDEVFIRGTDETIKIMDRCFFRDRIILSDLLAWAKNNGYWVKKYPDRANCDTYISPSGEEKDFISLSVKTGFVLKGEMYNEVPYVDTFCYCYAGGDRLYSYDQDAACLQDTDGAGDFLTGDYGRVCYNCDSRIDDDVAYYSERSGEWYCDECYSRLFFNCDSCCEDYYREESVTVVWEDGYDQRWCEHCANNTKDIVFCDLCGVYHHKNAPTINKVVGQEDKYICDECLRYSNIYMRCNGNCEDVYRVSDLNEDDLCPHCAEKNENKEAA